MLSSDAGRKRSLSFYRDFLIVWALKNTEEIMLDKVNDLKGFRMEALDGPIGTVAELYFDDRYWTVRYLVADTAAWLKERQVLISPFAVTSVNREDRTISVSQALQQIERGPTLEAHKPVSRQFEKNYHDHFGWPTYWKGPCAWGSSLYVATARDQMDRSHKEEHFWDHHLRSTKDVTGHHIQASDGEIGHVDDFVIDDESWTIRYFVVDTQIIWLGKKVLISPLWIDKIDWADRNVSVTETQDAVRNSPEYSEAFLLTRDYETRLHKHYTRLGYWDEDRAGVKHRF